MGSSRLGIEAFSKFILFYASQTGNANAIAEDLANQCTSKELHCELACISEIGKKYTLAKISCLVLIGSTTGDGDPPDTARKFWRQLNKKDQSPGTLSHLSYTVLGLGDTNYTNFCNFGKSVDQRLQCLGARRFYPCGWGDDGTGLEVVVEPWIEGLIPALKKHLLRDQESCDIISNGFTKDESEASFEDLSTVSKDLKSMSSNEPHNYTNLKETMADAEGISCDEPRTNFMNDVRAITEKHGMNLISQEDIKSLPIKSCIFSGDAKLVLPLQFPSYLALNILNDCTEEGIEKFSVPLSCAASGVIHTNLLSLRTLTRHNAVKRAIEVTLEFPEGSDVFDYDPGDSFGIIVRNPKPEVEVLLARLRLLDVADKFYQLTVVENTKKKNAAIPSFIPVKATLRYVFERCVDIRSVPKKPLLRTLVEYTSNPFEQRRLKELVCKEGGSEYSKYVRETNLTVLDLFIIFQSCDPPVTILLEQLPQLQPRSYSVTSSPLTDSGRISFVFNVIEISKEGTVTFPRKGICTGWLASFDKHFNQNQDMLTDALKNLSLGENQISSINIFLRSNQTFHLPKDQTTPIIMVGPGTGVAPFIGFLKHRQAMFTNSDEANIGESWLFFGCRHEERDHIYRAELESFLKKNALNHLHVSYSRDECGDGHPKYVQDNIRLNGADLCPAILEKGAFIYVCGDAKSMAKDVFEAFVSILETHRSLSTAEARKIIAQMQIERRYLQDVWA